MATQADIYKRACSKVSSAFSMSSGTPNDPNDPLSVRCDLQWEAAVNKVGLEYPWKHLTKRATLSETSVNNEDAQELKWQLAKEYAYQKPVNMIYPLEFYVKDETGFNNANNYIRANNLLERNITNKGYGIGGEEAVISEGYYYLSDMRNLNVKYIGYDSEVERWPSYFVECVALRLAAEIFASLVSPEVSSNTLMKIENDYRIALAKAYKAEDEAYSPTKYIVTKQDIRDM